MSPAEIPWELILSEQLAKWIAIVLALGSGLMAKYMATNYLAGRRIKRMGFQYNNRFKWDKMICAIVDIGPFKTTIKNLDTTEISSPIKNEKFEDKVIWMSNYTAANHPGRRGSDAEARKAEKDSNAR